MRWVRGGVRLSCARVGRCALDGWGGTSVSTPRPAGTTAAGRGLVGAPVIVGAGVPAALRAWPIAAGVASGSAWACAPVPGWAATGAGWAAPPSCRVVRRVRRCRAARWAERAPWRRRRLGRRVGGHGGTRCSPESGRVPRRFGPRRRSRGSMRLLRIEAAGCSPASCTGRSGRQGGVGVARAMSRRSRARSRVGSDAEGQPGPGQRSSRLRALVWGQARVCSAVGERGSGRCGRAARRLQDRRVRRGAQWVARWCQGPWRWPRCRAHRGFHHGRLSERRCPRGQVGSLVRGWTCRQAPAWSHGRGFVRWCGMGRRGWGPGRCPRRWRPRRGPLGSSSSRCCWCRRHRGRSSRRRTGPGGRRHRRRSRRRRTHRPRRCGGAVPGGPPPSSVRR